MVFSNIIYIMNMPIDDNYDFRFFKIITNPHNTIKYLNEKKYFSNINILEEEIQEEIPEGYLDSSPLEYLNNTSNQNNFYNIIKNDHMINYRDEKISPKKSSNMVTKKYNEGLLKLQFILI